MKKFLAMLCFTSYSLIAQKPSSGPDTIYCTSDNTSYLIFMDKVEWVDIGSPGDFFSQIEGNSVFIKARKPSAGISTLLVKTSSVFWYAVIKNWAGNKIFFYDFQKSLQVPGPVSGSDSIWNPSGAKGPEHSSSSSRLKQVVLAKNELFSMGFISKFMAAAVTVIRNDDKNTYLKIVLSNKSSIPYKLDFISFQYFRHLKKGFAKRAKKNGFDVYPLGRPGISQPRPGLQHLDKLQLQKRNTGLQFFSKHVSFSMIFTGNQKKRIPLLEV